MIGLYELLALVDRLQHQILFAEEQQKNDHKYLIEGIKPLTYLLLKPLTLLPIKAMVKSGLCLVSLLSSSTVIREKDSASIIRIIQYLTSHSTVLSSSLLSRYKDDHSHKLSHVYKLSLLLNEKFEYLLSTNTYSNSNSILVTDDNYTNLNGSFNRIMMVMNNNNENKKKIFLKRRQRRQ